MWTNVTTVGDLIDQQAERTDRVGLVLREQRLPYPELSQRSDQMAASLAALGVVSGDRVGILMPNSVDYVLALLATAKLGAIAVPVNGRFKAHEASYVVGHADVKVLLTAADADSTDYPGIVRQIVDDEGGLRDTIIVDLSAAADSGFMDAGQFWAEQARVGLEEVKRRQSRVRVRDIALLMYTSGTTARPKGCLLTHEAVVRQGEKVAVTRFHLTAEDALWDPLPMFHCGGIVPMLGVFSCGAKFCHPGFFEPGPSLEVIKRERCTVLYPAFEAIWIPLVTHPEFNEAELSHVRLVQNIATPERMEAYERQMPWARQVTSYGSTEGATNLTMGLYEDPAELRLRTLGPPVDGMEVKIVDPDTGDEVPPGVMGELCFRGYSCFEGYYREPELTATAFDAQGFFHSGDRACMEATGHLRYGGRIKDMIKIGGESVASIEIEDYLTTHPAVRIAQVLGVPDARYEEVAAAFVELNPGMTVTEQELIDFCLSKIATYKVPRYVRVVTEWPMSGTKVKKFELRERLLAELAPDGTVPEAPRPSRRRPEA